MLYDELKTLIGMQATLPLLSTNLEIKNVDYLSSNQVTIPHTHLFHEIYFAIQGHTKFQLDSEQVPLSEGDLLYLHPNVRHYRMYNPQDDYRCLVLGFDLTGDREPPQYSNEVFMKFIKDEQTLLDRLVQHRYWKASDQCGCKAEVDSICSCMQLHYMAGLVKIHACLSSFFIAAAQSLTGLRSREDFDDFSIGIVNRASKIYAYMINHCSENLGLQDVSDALFYSPRQIQRLLKEQYGINFIKMLSFCRVDRAKRLLYTTDIPLENISEKCGFGDYQNMRKHFQALEKTSPSSYRKKHGHRNSG